MNKQNHKPAFTLAEVLVTLAIIGVVASLTVPNIVKNYQDAALKAAWKKNFSDISQAFKMLATDNGGSLKGICASGAHISCLSGKLLPYLRAAKTCGYEEVYGSCWNLAADTTDFIGEAGNYDEQEYALVLSSGAFLNMGWRWSADCSYFTGSETLRWCSSILVDVNGFKGPNRMGKDIFGMRILENRVVAFGAQGTPPEFSPINSCPDDGVTFGGSSNSYKGYGCAAKYLYQ